MTAMNANGITIEYEVHGSANDPALILIRGLGTQLIHWPQVMIERLVVAGFYVVIFDNRDVGLSTKFEAAGASDLADLTARQAAGESIDVPYTLEDMAGDVIGLMDGLNIDRAHIAGISMGGMMAQVLAAKHSVRLRSMAAIMSHSGNPDLPQADPAARAALMDTPEDPNDREAAIEAIIASGQVLSGPGYPTPDKDRRKMAERAYDRCYCPDGRLRQRAAVVKSGNRVEMLRTITVPSQVIHGTDDPLLHISGGEDIAANIPNSEYHAIVGMGHETPASLATNLSDLIGDFARRADGG
ncbi:MAG: alpha/beta fold hydrolase [Rhodospirillaceae bacterium]|jgi:pimeloyl-ACP methyl ester carboxylesterase|nr:alpha/beta fold hydrolase [Rhodospirillaceae bacterium]MBT5081925.1 alpha/beta fold hydrolase [Rhodospirillaceae bacterium]MBT5523818.1 alpha/beta fold hydrolase [Rhodospirillaceae bacterium]MBT5879544.1 alpha/beta fold hydrolase [Rhodospirillaceae bacterium]MBT6589028.1 alpha/beta fold hydrolase [Rhodospirillaceae bacterium]